MKVDDDSYLRLDVVLEELHRISRNFFFRFAIFSISFDFFRFFRLDLDAPVTKFYAGVFKPVFHPVRDPKSKWYLSYDAYPANFGPSYVTGYGYFLSHDCVEYVFSIGI